VGGGGLTEGGGDDGQGRVGGEWAVRGDIGTWRRHWQPCTGSHMQGAGCEWKGCGGGEGRGHQGKGGGQGADRLERSASLTPGLKHCVCLEVHAWLCTRGHNMSTR
jgi:hypothetical protein